MEVKEKKADDVYENEVTLTIISVRSPNNVIKRVRNLPKINFEKNEEWHYQWWVGGVEVHLLIINKMPVEEPYYAWLTFSTGKKYDEYREKLAREIVRDSKYQVYLDLIIQLEQEGEDKMAYDVIMRFLSEMPDEQRKNMVMQMPDETRQSLLREMPVEERRAFLMEMPDEELAETLSGIPPERLGRILELLDSNRRGKK